VVRRAHLPEELAAGDANGAAGEKANARPQVTLVTPPHPSRTIVPIAMRALTAEHWRRLFTGAEGLSPPQV